MWIPATLTTNEECVRVPRVVDPGVRRWGGRGVEISVR